MPDEEVRSRTLSTNGVDLHVAEAGGEGPVVLLAHGFPELAYSWRHQLPALAEAGYRAVAPDQRGYGRSSRPEAVEDYDIHHLVGDLVGILDDLGAEQAVVVGHDWGSMVASHLALLHPERVAGSSTERAPPVPGGHGADRGDTQRHRRQLLLHALLPGPGRRRRRIGRRPRPDHAPAAGRRAAAARGGARPRPVRQRRARLRRSDPRARRPAGLAVGRGELDHYVEEFRRTGFTGGLNWYRNLDRNWETTPELAGATVRAPSLFVAGALDPVLFMSPPAAAHPALADHRGDVVVPGAGHWVQQEAPGAMNAALVGFLDDVWHDRSEEHRAEPRRRRLPGRGGRLPGRGPGRRHGLPRLRRHRAAGAARPGPGVAAAAGRPGFAGLHWPVEHGGRGLGRAHTAVWLEECARAQVSPYLNLQGLVLAGEAILRSGTDEQRRRYLPPTLTGELLWCQLFSEPGAGSDLTSLATSAVGDGESYRIDGTKIWSSNAQHAEYGILLARTDPQQRGHRGISFFLLDMATPGVEVRPIRQMTGDAEFCEVFLDGVAVPRTSRLGP